MKELMIVCGSRAEKIAAVSLLYGYGFLFDNEKNMQDAIENITDDDFPNVLLCDKSDGGADIYVCDSDYEQEDSDHVLITWNFSCLDEILQYLETRKNVSIPITRDYDAVISKEGIQVGCQKIQWKDFDKLVAATKKFR